jgi:hypothetical protein
MEQTWTQRADEVLQLMERAPISQNESEQAFRQAVRNLCQQVREADPQPEKYIVPSEPLF